MKSLCALWSKPDNHFKPILLHFNISGGCLNLSILQMALILFNYKN